MLTDDHIVGHHTWNYLLAWRDFVADRPITKSDMPKRIWLPGNFTTSTTISGFIWL
jgi:hypothetical protein